MLKEWPLVAFTIAGQMAVGVFLLFNVPFLLDMALPAAGRRGTWLVSMALVVALLVLAALVSFFHLHHPFRARYALSNLRTSWLSREILFELGFMALVVLAGLLAWSRPTGNGLVLGVLAAACLAGGLFLVSMAKLYMLPTLPVSSDAYTPLSFFLTALILGAMATELIARGPGSFHLPLLFIAFIFVAVEILLAIFIAPRHGIYGFRPGPSLRPTDESPRLLHWGRLALLAAGLVLIGLKMMGGFPFGLGDGRPGLALILAFAAVLTGEIAGRFLFYGLLVRPGR